LNLMMKAKLQMRKILELTKSAKLFKVSQLQDLKIVWNQDPELAILFQHFHL
jgi:hypothetical protein